MTRKRVLSGIQATADSTHLGNYLGAVRHWVSFQDEHDAFYCIADLHTLTVDTDPVVLRRRTLATAAQLLAAGINPDKCTFFLQSHVAQHNQLGWVMECIAVQRQVPEIWFGPERGRTLHLPDADGCRHSLVSSRPCPSW
jgi:tryptophanyl-tRNA synthetase